jgi:hypothetical protein
MDGILRTKETQKLYNLLETIMIMTANYCQIGFKNKIYTKTLLKNKISKIMRILDKKTT